MPMLIMFQIFFNIFNSWRYVVKMLLLLCSVGLTLFLSISITNHSNNRFFHYDINCNTSIFTSSILTNLFFLGYFICELRYSFQTLFNNVFNLYIFTRIYLEIWDDCIIYIDGYVYSNRAGFSVLFLASNLP